MATPTFKTVATAAVSTSKPRLERGLFWVLAVTVVIYAALAGLRTVSDYDLGWQLATGRWVAQHGHVTSVDVFSYTASGQPWVYPVGSGLLFYGIYILGGYALLSWLGAATCAGTIVLLLRRGSPATAVVALFAVPLVASRTVPRAEMFTTLLFAAFLSLLWRYQQSGAGRLWLLPLLMVIWVNLHLGFIAGLALIVAYVSLELLDCVSSTRRPPALQRLNRASPWLLATLAATLINPWGWGLYAAIVRQQKAMALHSAIITEWAAVPLSSAAFLRSLSLHTVNDAFYLLFAIGIAGCVVALLQRRWGAAVLLVPALFFGARHYRNEALFACVVVVVAGDVFAAALKRANVLLPEPRGRAVLAWAATALVLLLGLIRSLDLVTNRRYLVDTTTASFGPGLSWWFPERAFQFIAEQNLPGRIFNTYNEGGFFLWSLGENYQDYADGRAIPFSHALLDRHDTVLTSAPDSAEWEHEIRSYNINTIVVPLGRYDGLQFFPHLRDFCQNSTWRPVYLDEVSAVFVHRIPDTESLIQKFQLDCATAPIPATPRNDNSSTAFNQWANAAGVLRALGRNTDAFAATSRALAIFDGSANVHFTRGILYQESGNLRAAEGEYRFAAELEPRAVAPWATLAALLEQQARWPEAAEAWTHAADISPRPWEMLLSAGFSYLQARKPAEALATFDRAERNQPPPATTTDNSYLVGIARGRALAYQEIGNLSRAIAFEQAALKLAPSDSTLWTEISSMYARAGRLAEAQQAQARARASAQQLGPVQ